MFAGNMLLTGDQKHVKLADFGLAREETKGFMTCEAGTYRWMAPEVIVSSFLIHKTDFINLFLTFTRCLFRFLSYSAMSRF